MNMTIYIKRKEVDHKGCVFEEPGTGVGGDADGGLSVC